MAKPILKIVRHRHEDHHYFTKLNLLLDQIFSIATSKRKWTWGQLASQAGIAAHTVIRLGERETQYPHLRTVLRLADAVGLDVKLVPISVPMSKPKKKAM